MWEGDFSWEEIYSCWQIGVLNFGKSIYEPLPVELVHVPYERDGYFYGYDWLSCESVIERKKLIDTHPDSFWYFMDASRKGTIMTAEMLALSQNQEERAAIWVAATSFEMLQRFPSKTLHFVHQLSCQYLKGKYYMWHHAMRGLVPDIMIPLSVMENTDREDLDTVVGLIQMNAYMLQNAYKILLYSSLKDGEQPIHHMSRL